MIFVGLAQALALAMVILGILSIGYGVWLLVSPMMSHGASSEGIQGFIRQHGLPKTINEGFAALLLGCALGVLAHIGRSRRKAD